MEGCYSVDIDDYLDIKVVEYYLEKEREKEINWWNSRGKLWRKIWY